MVTADKSMLVCCVITFTDQTEVERHDGGERGEKNSGNEQKVLRIKWTGEDEAGASPEEEIPFLLVGEEETSQKTSAGPNLLVSFPNI